MSNFDPLDSAASPSPSQSPAHHRTHSASASAHSPSHPPSPAHSNSSNNSDYHSSHHLHSGDSKSRPSDSHSNSHSNSNSASASNQPETFNLFVGDIPRSAVDADLRAAFEKFGEIHSATILRERKPPNLSRGCGFVNFLSEAAQDAAAKAEVEILGKPTKHSKSEKCDTLIITGLDWNKYKSISELQVILERISRVDMRELKVRGEQLWAAYSSYDDSLKAFRVLRGSSIDGCRIFVKPLLSNSSADTITIFVKNLHPSTTDDSLKELFDQHGSVLKCNIVRDANGVSKAFGFVIMSSGIEECEKIIKTLNGTELHGKPLGVKFADRNIQSRDERPREHRSEDRHYHSNPAEGRGRERAADRFRGREPDREFDRRRDYDRPRPPMPYSAHAPYYSSARDSHYDDYRRSEPYYPPHSYHPEEYRGRPAYPSSSARYEPPPHYSAPNSHAHSHSPPRYDSYRPRYPAAAPIAGASPPHSSSADIPYYPPPASSSSSYSHSSSIGGGKRPRPFVSSSYSSRDFVPPPSRDEERERSPRPLAASSSSSASASYADRSKRLRQ